ncbi:MAG: MBL fold metallo-hydrolase [Methylococcaceae bacterium]|nr:MAG: MBL fold metallo-hydrolase [Methylococcaceae bacterium]
MKKIILAGMCLASLSVANAAKTTDPIIKVTLLGTGVPLLNADVLEANGRALSGLLIEAGSERMLFDVGQGVYNRLIQSGGGVMNPNVGVDKVFISHLHSDHIADLAPLYSIGGLYRHPDAQDGDVQGFNGLETYAFPTTTPLRVWGPGGGPNQPVGTWAMMQNFRTAYQTDIYLRTLWSGWDASLGLDAVETLNATQELFEGVVYENNGVKVTAFLVNHEPVSPSYGFRVDYSGHSVVFSGDTAPTPNLLKNATNADVIVHEVYGFAESDAPNIYAYHTSPEDAATLFKRAKPKLAVYTHLVVPPGTTPNDLADRTRAAGYKGKLELGVDLMVINVTANTVKVQQPSTAAAINSRKAKGEFMEVARARKSK